MNEFDVQWTRRRLHFNFEARTSRGSMLYKDTYFVRISRCSEPAVYGLGECPLFAGLSREDAPDYEDILADVCHRVGESGMIPDNAPSSVRMGLETALADLRNGGNGILVPGTDWLNGSSIEINGLVWMGDKRLMAERIRQKLDAGFRCVKLKIGGIDFEDELELLSGLRSRFPASALEIRVDANGAFSPDNVMERLERLSRYGIHSIEQPIAAGQYDAMARVCADSPVPVALDEELIGDTTPDFKQQLLSFLRPAYIILKAALCGGFAGADAWIDAARREGIGWWATSALESSVGLNAIAQWVSAYSPAMPQGLGTGALYTDNLPAQYVLRGSRLYFDPTAIRAGAPECGFDTNE